MARSFENTLKPAPEAPRPSAGGQGALAAARQELDQLRRALEQERATATSLEAELAAIRAGHATPYVHKLEAQIADLRERMRQQAALIRARDASPYVLKLEAQLAELQERMTQQDKDITRLTQHLRWHWSTYPETVQAWDERDELSDPFGARQRALRSRLIEMMGAPEFPAQDRRVTLVVTSCGRHDLLEQNLESFFRLNTWPLEKAIVIEDGEEAFSPALKARFEGQPIEWLNTGRRVGQIRAVDIAYSRVDTPYLFHAEDDWSFETPGFIEASLAILEADPLCLQVWLLGQPGPTGHQLEDETRETAGARWRRVAKGHGVVWHGFSFNPGLRRLRDYRLIGASYAANVESAPGAGGVAEGQLSELYESVGFFAASLWVGAGEPVVRHLGRGRHVS